MPRSDESDMIILPDPNTYQFIPCRPRELRDALGDHAFNSFIQDNKVEWDRYRTHVTDYELKNYPPII
ncbi:hypothetical protein ACFLTN_06855 [Chloroflexota bacterium]